VEGNGNMTKHYC